MRYHDGQIAKVGDVVNLAGRIGRVVCSIDDGEYSAEYPEKQCAIVLHKNVVITFWPTRGARKASCRTIRNLDANTKLHYKSGSLAF
jgi:hypothetical protein